MLPAAYGAVKSKVNWTTVVIVVTIAVVVFVAIRSNWSKIRSGISAATDGRVFANKSVYADPPDFVREQELNGGLPTDDLPQPSTAYQNLARRFIDEFDGVDLTGGLVRWKADKLLMELDNLSIKELVAVDFIVAEKSGYNILSYINDDWGLDSNLVSALNRKLS